MFSFFKKKPKVNIEMLGFLPDARTPEEQAKDYKADEIILSYAAFEWKEKPESEWVKFPIFNQDGSSTCVSQAVAKVLGIENYLEEGKFVQYSARDIYTRRINYPDPGMFFDNGMNIGYSNGATFEQLMPSQNLSENQMNNSSDRTPLTEIAGRIGRGGNYISLPIDIEAIASVIETKKKGVVIGLRFGPNEWQKEVPEILGTDMRWGHAVCATNALLYQGKKSLVIEDSWGTNTGINGRRILTEDWFNTPGRIVAAYYYEFLSNGGLNTKPQYRFTKDLRYGMIGDPDVIKLQECLAYLKLFPTGQEFTGNFYGITLKAVKLFQEQNEITPASGFVGPITRQKLNEIFG